MVLFFGVNRKLALVDEMKKGDVVLVDFTATELTQNTVFETTRSSDAQQAGVFNPKAIYKPIPVVIGQRDFFPLIEKELETMQVGDEKKMVLDASDAFGERSADKIALVSLQEFKKQKMHPIPGLIIEADGRQGRVQSVSGGRVRVDFNHPLAGKRVEYKIIIRKKIEDKKEQAVALLEKFFPHLAESERKVTLENGTLAIELPERLKAQPETELLKQLVAKILPEQLDGIQRVEFSGELDKKTDPTQALQKNEKKAGSAQKPIKNPKQKNMGF